VSLDDTTCDQRIIIECGEKDTIDDVYDDSITPTDTNENVNKDRGWKENGHDYELGDGRKQLYIGETARTLRQRAMEHWDKLRLWGTNSFILRHWVRYHGTSVEPPRIKFKALRQFREPLGRQIMEALLIIESGTMNMKNEFGANHLCGLESSKSNWDQEVDRRKEDDMKKKEEADLKQFIYAMSKIVKLSKKNSSENVSNPLHNCRSQSRELKRSLQRAPDQSPQLEGGNIKRKKRRMDSSTPRREINNEMVNDEDLISPIPIAGNQVLMSAETSNNTTDGGGDGMAGTDRTNLSDRVRSMCLGGERRRLHDSTTEFIIEVLNLEDAAGRAGILLQAEEERKKVKYWEWLNLEALAERLTQEPQLTTVLF